MTAPLRICMVTTFYPPYHFGGDAIAVQRLSRALVRAGHDVTVVHDVDAYRVMGGPVPDGAEAQADGVRVVALSSRFGHVSKFLTQQIGRPFAHAARLRALLDHGRFDVVNFPGILGWGDDAVRLYMAHEHWLVCPTHVLWRHGREVCTGRECVRCQLHYGRPPQLWRMMGVMERGLQHIDAFIAMSAFSRDKHREFGFPYDMEVLPPFLPAMAPADVGSPDVNVSRPPVHDRPYFLFVGRLERIKGLDDVIPLFTGEGAADLLIVGDGGHRVSLEALAAGSPRVRFLGWKDADALDALYQQAQALIMPSVCYETFGITILEAFRQGTPVIARDIGPFPDIVQRSGGGVLFSSPEALAQALHAMLEHTAMRDRMAAAAREAFAAHWSETVVVPQYVEIARRAAARRHQTPSRATLHG